MVGYKLTLILMELDTATQQHFLNGLLKGNRLLCSSIVIDLIKNNVSLKDIYEELIKKSLYEVGELWEFNKISVATEHLASAIAESILNEHYLLVASHKKINKTVLLACVENEHHQIGVKMIGDIFEMNGWNTFFLGSNTPTSDLIAFAKTIHIDFLAVSLSIYFHLPELEKLIKEFQKEFSDIPILVGGQAFRHGGGELIKKYPNVVYQPNLISTDKFIKTLYNYE